MKLSDKACKAAKPKDTSYKLFDGGGLFLEVMPNGSKLWRVTALKTLLVISGNSRDPQG